MVGFMDTKPYASGIQRLYVTLQEFVISAEYLEVYLIYSDKCN
jgi:hypothetical protein